MKRTTRVALLLGVLAAGATLAFAGAKPEGFQSVDAVLADPDAFEGREVHVKATVLEGSLRRDAEPVTFVIGGEFGSLEVRWSEAHPLPDHEAGGTIEGKNVVVVGQLARDTDGALYLAAQEMTVGCASKYRPAE